MSAATLVAMAVSAALILLLCIGDPKRRRASRTDGGAQSSRTRWLLTAALCLPGLYLALIGDAAAFLIWLGACSVAGWFIALGFGGRRRGGA